MCSTVFDSGASCIPLGRGPGVKEMVKAPTDGYPKLSQLRDGLKLFMRHFILKENSKKCVNISEEFKASVTQAEHNLLAGDKKFML